MLGLFEIAKTRKNLEEAYALNKRIMTEYTALKEENEKLKAQIKKMNMETELKRIEIQSFKSVFKEFYQTVYEKAEQDRNLWAGLNKSLVDVPAENITSETINSLVAASKERKLTDTQIREMLWKHGIKYNG